MATYKKDSEDDQLPFQAIKDKAFGVDKSLMILCGEDSTVNKKCLITLSSNKAVAVIQLLTP